jgi:hypothetical protein
VVTLLPALVGNRRVNLMEIKLKQVLYAEARKELIFSPLTLRTGVVGSWRGLRPPAPLHARRVVECLYRSVAHMGASYCSRR